MKKKLSIDDYCNGIVNNDRVILGKALTLMESNADIHNNISQNLLNKIMPHTGNSIRIGITGAPGVGKSTFIDKFGYYLINSGYRVAVLSVDPSSSISGGSILGDKTRMEKLSSHENSFIRPSPSKGAIGGVARKTRESILICEAAGYNVIIIETVGVGQNELEVHSMVDFFMLIQIAGAGDELQGIKKGIVELADAIVINKADGDNKQNVLSAVNVLKGALAYLNHRTDNWQTQVLACSALSEEGIKEIWHVISKFRKLCTGNDEFKKKRERQRVDWFDNLLNEEIKKVFFRDKEIKHKYSVLKKEVLEDKISIVHAVRNLTDIFRK